MKHHVQNRLVSGRKGLAALLCLMLCAPLQSPAATSTTTQTLQATLTPIGKVSVSSTATLTHAGTTFATFTGTVAVSYRARTTPAGSGTITVQGTSDFSPAGGPLISSGNLTYTCSGSTLGTACSGTQTLSMSSATNVITLPASACTGGGGACSGSDPNTVSMNLSLTDDTGFKTGAYSGTITFTISAT